MKWFKRFIIALFLLVGLILISAIVLVNPFGPSPINDYPKDGQLRLAGLKRPVHIVRDEKGMPFIYADDMEDVIFAQGFVMAMDRLFQMELLKLLVSGRIGELTGRKARNLDVRMRTLGFHRHARRHIQLLNAQTKALLQKYADGINAFITTQPEAIPLEFKLAGSHPTPWTAADVLTILYFMGWNSAANLHNEIVSQLLVEKLGWTRALQIFPLNLNPAENALEGKSGSDGPPHIASLGSEIIDRLLAFAEERPLRVGSNNWVVGPDRSVSGKPILANDPHLEASMLPGPWYPCGLITPQFRAVGVTIAGTPGITVGRTDHLAFGVTNAYGDAQDLYVETVDPHDSRRYMEGTHSIPFKVIEETLRFKDRNAPGGFASEIIHIRATHRGPVIDEVLPPLNALPSSGGKGKVITVRWSAFEAMGPSLGFERFWTCRNTTQFRDALKDVRQICLNYVFADQQGHIGWQATGRLPVRDQGDGRLPYVVRDGRDNWHGWVPFEQMPHADDPANGWLGTTNNKTVTRTYPYYYSDYYASPYRQERLMQLMADAAPKAAADHWNYQRDILNLKAARIAPLMAGALLNYPDTAEMGRMLNGWNHLDSADQIAPTLFHAIFDEFARLVYVDELGETATDIMLSNTYYWEERLLSMIEAGNSPWFDDIRTPDITETQHMLWHRAALNAAARLAVSWGDDRSAWQWGKIHRYEFVSPIARKGPLKRWLGGGTYPAEGSGDTLRRAKSAYGDLSKVSLMASLRMVADLGDPDKVLAVLPGGVTGRLFDPHTTDQIEPYIDGKVVYWWFSDKAIKAHATHELALMPKN
jgi:penicillin G amidase